MHFFSSLTIQRKFGLVHVTHECPKCLFSPARRAGENKHFTLSRSDVNYIPDGGQIVCKTYMTRVENTRLLHHLARLHRKTL